MSHEQIRMQRRATFWEMEGRNDSYSFEEYEDYLEHGDWNLLEEMRYLRKWGWGCGDSVILSKTDTDPHVDDFDEEVLEEELLEIDSHPVILDPDEVDPSDEEPWKIPR